MKLLADLHTHSKNSRFFHGKNSITEMVFHANELGLKEIAITDHSYKHLFRTSKDKLYDARLTIDDLNKWSKTKVLLGVEANILDENGTIDIDAETLALIDILVVGYHRMIKTDFAGYFGGQPKTEEAKEKATNAFLNAISKYPITILSHVDSVLTTDLYKIGKACAEKGVMVEINNRHTNWTQQQVDDLLASGCTFVVSSDAHCREDIGEVSHAFDIITKYNIPSESIANVEFDYDEMTEEHKEINLMYENYLRTQGKIEKQAKIQEIKEDEDDEFETMQTQTSTKEETSPRLSSEMENELEKIALEKGYAYTRPRERSSVLDFSENRTSSASETEAEENTARFLNAINRIGDALSSEETEAIEEPNPEEIEEETLPETEFVDAKSEEENISKTTNMSLDEEQNKILSHGGAVVVKNEDNKADSTAESNPDEVINMFAVNKSQQVGIKKREENLKLNEKGTKKSKIQGVKPGAFVDISSLTDETDETK